MPGQQGHPKRSVRPVCRTFTMQVTQREVDAIEKLSRLRRSTRSSAVRFAVSQALFLAEAEEQRKQFALVNEAGEAVIVHFVM